MNYVNNTKLHNAIEESKEKGQLTKEAYEYLNEMMLRLSGGYKRNLYPSYEDIIQGAWVLIIPKFHLYQPKKGTNAFAYFTRTIINAINESIRRQNPKELPNSNENFEEADNSDWAALVSNIKKGV